MDIAIQTQNHNGQPLTIDFAIKNGDLVMADDNGLWGAVATSLFCEAKPKNAIIGIETNKNKGWSLENINWDAKRRFGSLLWQARRSKSTSETARAQINYANAALQWLVDDRIVKSIAIDGKWENASIFHLNVKITLLNGQSVNYPFNVDSGIL